MDQNRDVWIVLNESAPDNPIIGVFGTAESAQTYFEQVASQYPEDTFALGRYPIDQTHEQWGSGTARYRGID
ncbi:hypothetical protein D9V34_08645 [Mycetocola lacteus]|uniref:Uncharacterized protein n=1 Tax=Mycetocola lacteus TaxID=76637 RepID=A0A3L7AS00_9MICO|nr:hypothetical protein [Mycetocola lacteus]RLP83283.1 hypothetical protein D9V34_08645 [Mycetocola lacteus]